MNSSSRKPEIAASELEVIACSVADALAAHDGRASRLEVTVRLDQAGLTPPLDLVRKIIQRVPLPIRVMLRDRSDFSLGGGAELENLMRKACGFVGLNICAQAGGGIDGFVVGHIKEGKLDFAALETIINAAPNMHVTVHHAIEATRDPLETLRALRKYPSVDRALVSGGPGSVKERIDRLVRMREAFGPDRSLIVGGNVTLEMLKPLRDATGVRIFHLGRAVRTPEESGGSVDRKKVMRAASLIGLTRIR